MDERTVRWGILGPGSIARAFAGGLAASRSGRLVALGARQPERPDYVEHFPGVPAMSVEALLASSDVDAIYIATPHPQHAQWAIRAVEAGKHVLCEKPMGLSFHEAEAMFAAAARAGVFMGEAYMYRLHPQTARLLEIIADGTIGDVRMISSSFGFDASGAGKEHRLFANALAGGGILDVGGYPVSMVRLIAGAAEGKPVAEPIAVHGTAQLGATGVDEWAAATLTFASGIIAEVSCAVALAQENVLRVVGSKGRLEVTDFWFGSGRLGGVGKITVVPAEGATHTISVPEEAPLYSFEAEAASRAILEGRHEFASPGMSWDDTLGNMVVLDTWRRDAGLVYSIETPAARVRTLRGDPLARAETATIPSIALPGLDKPASRLALGFEHHLSFAAGAVLLDSYFERGGSVFDTAWQYQNGLTESILGDWLQANGVRDAAVVIGKGAHTPLCYPDVIARQLAESLERLRTDYVDVYFLHRDNTDIPVDEFVDALDREVAAGRIRGLVGGSNWTRERMAAARDYAQRSGKTVPNAISNNFALARMVNPIWPGCVAASDADYRRWIAETGIVNFAWSSQARGFFTDRAGREKRADDEMVQAWYAEDNFERRERAYRLADALGAKPIHIALAYVLAVPETIVPLIGPRRISELDDSLRALALTLSPEQVRWLETGGGAMPI